MDYEYEDKYDYAEDQKPYSGTQTVGEIEIKDDKGNVIYADVDISYDIDYESEVGSPYGGYEDHYNEDEYLVSYPNNICIENVSYYSDNGEEIKFKDDKYLKDQIMDFLEEDIEGWFESESYFVKTWRC